MSIDCCNPVFPSSQSNYKSLCTLCSIQKQFSGTYCCKNLHNNEMHWCSNHYSSTCTCSYGREMSCYVMWSLLQWMLYKNYITKWYNICLHILKHVNKCVMCWAECDFPVRIRIFTLEKKAFMCIHYVVWSVQHENPDTWRNITLGPARDTSITSEHCQRLIS